MGCGRLRHMGAFIRLGARETRGAGGLWRYRERAGGAHKRPSLKLAPFHSPMPCAPYSRL